MSLSLSIFVILSEYKLAVESWQKDLEVYARNKLYLIQLLQRFALKVSRRDSEI